MKKDYTGMRFGKLSVISEHDKVTSGGNKIIAWDCICDCGKNLIVSSSALRNGQKNCISCRGKDHIGERYGRLLVVEISGRSATNTKIYKCKCDCGNTVELSYSALIGGTVSCGCYSKEIFLKNVAKYVKSDENRLKHRADSITRKPGILNTSGIKGVSWQKNIQKWFAYIEIEKKRYNLGYYENIKDDKRRQLFQGAG